MIPTGGELASAEVNDVRRSNSPRPAPISVSVVRPTFNRRERLARVLRSLEQQTFEGAFEAVVVSDGSTDGTGDLLASADLSLDLVVLEQQNSGPAVARNRGIETAKHDLILFLDYDVVPAPDLVAEHVAAHQRADGERLAVIGPMLSPEDAVYSPWGACQQSRITTFSRRSSRHR